MLGCLGLRFLCVHAQPNNMASGGRRTRRFAGALLEQGARARAPAAPHTTPHGVPAAHAQRAAA